MLYVVSTVLKMKYIEFSLLIQSFVGIHDHIKRLREPTVDTGFDYVRYVS